MDLKGMVERELLQGELDALRELRRTLCMGRPNTQRKHQHPHPTTVKEMCMYAELRQKAAFKLLELKYGTKARAPIVVSPGSAEESELSALKKLPPDEQKQRIDGAVSKGQLQPEEADELRRILAPDES